MDVLHLLPVFLVGLLGGVHCIGMCGGIVAALSTTPRRFPVPVITLGAPALALDNAVRTLSYNAGRIGSYAIAGSLVGGAVGGARALAGATGVVHGAYLLASLMLVALGLHLAGWWPGVAQLERIGQPLWRRVSGMAKRIGPMDSAPRLFLLGSLWGWLPCGMVYSVLLTAMFSGSALRGAAVMLAFGLGTLPVLLAAGMLGAQLRGLLQRRGVRAGAGAVVLTYGVLGVIRFLGPLPSWANPLCVGPLS